MKYSDTEILDWLQSKLALKKYTGKALFRWSVSGRGFRLHETSLPCAVDDVRQAIINAIEQENENK